MPTAYLFGSAALSMDQKFQTRLNQLDALHEQAQKLLESIAAMTKSAVQGQQIKTLTSGGLNGGGEAISKLSSEPANSAGVPFGFRSYTNMGKRDPWH